MRPRALAVATCGLIALASTTCTNGSGGARARAQRISASDQLIGGPKAIGRIGDYLLENDQVRFIIHGPGSGRASTLFPGAVIDADLQRPAGSDNRGNDQLGEIIPAFVFEAMNPTAFSVTSDGSDGGAAVISVEGVGDDLLQQVAILNTALLFPPNLRFRVDYRLEPGARYLEIVTTLINDSDAAHPLPFLDPPELADLGLDIPGLDTLQLSVPLGHMLLFGEENHVFAPGVAGFNVRFSVVDSYADAPGLPAFPGILTDFVATRADGVSYGFIAARADYNYPWSQRDLYESDQLSDRAVLLPFLFSAVLAAFHANPPASLPPRGEFSFTAYLAVGRGDVASVASVAYQLHGITTGRFGGRVVDARSGAPVRHASIVVQDTAGHYVTQLDTDGDGAFAGDVPEGDYVYRVQIPDRDTTAPVAFTVRAGAVASALVQLPPPAELIVNVTDEHGRAPPCKVTLVGQFAAADAGRDPRAFLYDLAVGEPQRRTSLEPDRTDFVEAAWYAPDGRLRRTVRPGRYELIVSRGFEYDLYREPIELTAGVSLTRSIALARGVDTGGYVGADLHVHSVNSVDSALSLPDRVISLAAEGVEFAAATDHNFITDYAPAIAATGLTQWLVSTVGLEITTFEMGHFNGYPLRVDAASTRGGEFEWARQPPQVIFAELRAMGRYGPDETIVQVNHPRWDFLGYFNVFNLVQDTGQTADRDGLRSVLAPYGPEFARDQFRLDFDVLEIINGARQDLVHTYRVPEQLPPPPLPDPVPPAGEVLRDEYGQVAFPGAMEDWFALLNHGHRFIGVGTSDSHRGIGDEAGCPRTLVWVGEGRDEPGAFTERDVIAGLRSRNAIITFGPMIAMTVDGAPIGSDVTTTDGTVDVAVRVTSADWVPVDRLRLWANGVLVADVAIEAAQAHDFSTTVTLSIDRDTWVIAEVDGDANLFPIVSAIEYEPLSPQVVVTALGSSLDLSALDPWGNLRPAQTFFVRPQAMTNPIWIDRDGNGAFDPPMTGGLGDDSQRAGDRTGDGAAAADIDVRAIFDALEAAP